MPNFKKLNPKIYQKSGPVITPDYIYWKQLGVPVLVKEFGPIDYIDFSPVEPHYFAVTCSVRVQVYNPITKLVVKNLSRFRESAFGATFRDDGRLIVAGGEEMNVKLFDVSTKSLLRLFKGHSAPVHRTFFINNRPLIASFSDDKSVKIWDIPTEKPIITYSDAHNDYIRAGATNNVVQDVILSGGYDGIVKMFDSRSEKEVLTVKHGCPVESLLFLPSGGVFLSAGGTEIKIWDSFAGGKLLGSVSQHHKTITCLRLASDNKRFLSGSLDRHVKIYDVSSFKVVHTLDFPNAVLSLGVSKNDDTLVAGLVDGLVSISRREMTENSKTDTKKVNFKFASLAASLQKVDVIVPEEKPEKEAKHEHFLRKFQFSKALDSVLLPYVSNKHPETTVLVMQELLRRKALHKAITGRDKKFIMQFLRFILRNIVDIRFTRVLIDVTNEFLNVYESEINNLPPEVSKLILELKNLLDQECKLYEDLAMLQGMMHMLLAADRKSVV